MLTLHLKELQARTLLEINISDKAKQNFAFLYKTNLDFIATARNNTTFNLYQQCNISRHKQRNNYHLKVEQKAQGPCCDRYWTLQVAFTLFILEYHVQD